MTGWARSRQTAAPASLTAARPGSWSPSPISPRPREGAPPPSGSSAIVDRADGTLCALRGNAIYVAWNDGALGKSHIRLATSTDGGRTWAASFVTHGSGHANVSDGPHQYFAWGDNRSRVTNFLYPNGRNDPNVFFAKQ